MSQLSFNIKETRAVLIGIDNYTFLRKVPCAKDNINDFAALLEDPQILGIPKKSIRKIVNKQNDTILRELKDFINEDANINVETLILYYIGHGLRDKSSQELYLT